MIVKTLTIHQPWAELLARGYKKLETRSWNTKYRGVLLIHASQTPSTDYSFSLPEGFPPADQIYCGAIIAIAQLTRTFTISCNRARGFLIGQFGRMEDAYGDLSAGRFAWWIGNAMPIEPIPARGKQGLWNGEIPDEIYGRYLERFSRRGIGRDADGRSHFKADGR